jgi:hypothetical protein
MSFATADSIPATRRTKGTSPRREVPADQLQKVIAVASCNRRTTRSVSKVMPVDGGGITPIAQTSGGFSCANRTVVHRDELVSDGSRLHKVHTVRQYYISAGDDKRAGNIILGSAIQCGPWPNCPELHSSNESKRYDKDKADDNFDAHDAKIAAG